MKTESDLPEWLRRMSRDFIAGKAVNPCPNGLNAAADKIDSMSARIVGDGVLKKHYQGQIESLTAELHKTQNALDGYMDAYTNMRNFAIEKGLDVAASTEDSAT